MKRIALLLLFIAGMARVVVAAPPQLSKPQREVTREVLLTAIKDSILDSAELKVTSTRPGGAGGPCQPEGRPKEKSAMIAREGCLKHFISITMPRSRTRPA